MAHRPGLLPAGTALLGAGTVALAVSGLPDGSAGAGSAALAVPGVVLLLAARSIQRGRAVGPLLALAGSSAVAYLAAGAVGGLDRSGTTDDVVTSLLLPFTLLFLAAAVTVASWHALPAGSVTLERRTRVLVGVLLLAAVWGLLLARHLTVPPAAGGLPVRGADALADLVVLPAAAAAGAGLLARAAWAGAAAFASAGCLALAGAGTVGDVWSQASPGTPAVVPWTGTALGVTAAVPAVLCWTAVVRTGRQYWGGRPAAAAPAPARRPPPVPAPRYPRGERVPGPAVVAARTARRSGT